MAEEEDEDVEGVAVLPSSRGSVGYTGTAWRSSRARWMGEGGLVAVATASGGDGILGHGGGTEERGRSERASGRWRGTRGGVQKRRKQEVASRAATTRPASLWRPSGARWETVAALVGWASSWAVVGRQVSPGEGPSGLLSLT